MNHLAKVNGTILGGVDCKDILKDFYGFKTVNSVKRMSGWCDVTFLVTNENFVPFIFKIFIDVFTSSVEQIEAEIELIKFLWKKNFPVPRIIPTVKGKLYGECSFVDDEKGVDLKRFRLQTYIDGNILGHDIKPEVCSQMGDIAGTVDIALQSFRNSTYPLEPDFIIQFSEEVNIRQLVEKLPNSEHQEMASRFFKLYEKDVTKKMDDFPKQQIHCDMHGANLIVDPNSSRIIGLIDFSDSKYTLRVIEAAISLGSILVFSKEPIAGCKQFFTAYMKHVKLIKTELDALRTIIIGRMIQNMAMNAYFELTVPGFNAGYLESLHGNSWNMVAKLLDPSSEESRLFDTFAKLT